mmetsp:Transcript_70831/g.198510  ORF Transcript_70831/g.198510 Transcript_70831/m.198510 type:complete len:241 (+) Transcript_70831:138-860(+)
MQKSLHHLHADRFVPNIDPNVAPTIERAEWDADWGRRSAEGLLHGEGHLIESLPLDLVRSVPVWCQLKRSLTSRHQANCSLLANVRRVDGLTGLAGRQGGGPILRLGLESHFGATNLADYFGAELEVGHAAPHRLLGHIEHLRDRCLLPQPRLGTGQVGALPLLLLNLLQPPFAGQSHTVVALPSHDVEALHGIGANPLLYEVSEQPCQPRLVLLNVVPVTRRRHEHYVDPGLEQLVIYG